MSFNPMRLRIARERRAMSKKGFADQANIPLHIIFSYESGVQAPPDEAIERLATVLNFPVAFFYGEDVDYPRRDNASFRGLASKSGKVMDAALASGAMAFLFDDWIWRSDRYERIEPDLPDLSSGSELIAPDLAAQILRQQWRLGDKPIENMVHLLEAKGVHVFSLAENTKDVDAYSVWRDDVPYVFLNRFKTAERSRFDAAHELAHLCLDKHGGAAAIHKNSPIEARANAFAGAFLMPETDMRAVITSTIYSVDDLLTYKRRWRVSAAALAYRAREIGLINDARLNSLYVELSRRGWLKYEPEGIQREQSHIWQQVMDNLRGEGITKIDIARQIGIPVQEIESWLFGLANMVTIEGEGATTPPRKTNLRLVS